MSSLKIMGFAYFIFGLVGCASTVYKKQYCSKINVSQQGYQDGLKGLPVQSFSVYQKKCGDYVEIAPKKQEYEQGWQKAIKVFCTTKGGYEFGLHKGKYLKVCPLKLEPAFLKGYKAGNKKCLYESGYKHVMAGKKHAFKQSSCQTFKGYKKFYMAGRLAGIKVFCTYKSGYNYGLAGHQYQGICPKKLETEFFKGWTMGYQLYQAGKRQEEIRLMEKERREREQRRHAERIALEGELIAAERTRRSAERASRQMERDLERERIRMENDRIKSENPDFSQGW